MTDHEKWMWEAIGKSAASKDPSRKTGCVILRSGFSEGPIFGFNKFPMGVKETPERFLRPAKYAFTEHAERVAIYKAARRGQSLSDATVYLNWFPCADCARALVGISAEKLVCFEPDWTEERYGFREAKAILEEGGVEIIYLDREKFRHAANSTENGQQEHTEVLRAAGLPEGADYGGEHSDVMRAIGH